MYLYLIAEETNQDVNSVLTPWLLKGLHEKMHEKYGGWGFPGWGVPAGVKLASGLETRLPSSSLGDGNIFPCYLLYCLIFLF